VESSAESGCEMTNERVAELRALRALAASGEWKADTHGVVAPDGDAELGTWRVCKTDWAQNALWIEAASNALPDALGDIEKLRGERDALAAHVDELRARFRLVRDSWRALGLRAGR
jgi:hypothetical protein